MTLALVFLNYVFMFKRKRILIVDNEKDLRENLGEILRLKGYNVLEAVSRAEALRKIKECNIDLVLLDMQLLGMQGGEACAAMKKACPKIVIFLITGTICENNAQKVIQYGAEACIYKPFRAEEISEKINKYLK